MPDYSEGGVGSVPRDGPDQAAANIARYLAEPDHTDRALEDSASDPKVPPIASLGSLATQPTEKSEEEYSHLTGTGVGSAREENEYSRLASSTAPLTTSDQYSVLADGSTDAAKLASAVGDLTPDVSTAVPLGEEMYSTDEGVSTLLTESRTSEGGITAYEVPVNGNDGSSYAVPATSMLQDHTENDSGLYAVPADAIGSATNAAQGPGLATSPLYDVLDAGTSKPNSVPQVPDYRPADLNGSKNMIAVVDESAKRLADGGEVVYSSGPTQSTCEAAAAMSARTVIENLYSIPDRHGSADVDIGKSELLEGHEEDPNDADGLPTRGGTIKATGRPALPRPDEFE